MLLLHESREDLPDPTTDTHLSPSSALYSTSAPNNNGKTRYKNNRGNKNTGRVFSIKDLNIGHLLHRSDSIGDLYLVLQSSPPFVPSATALVVVSPLVGASSSWSSRVSTFNFFKSRNFISCSNTLLPTCHARQLGKHCRLSFSNSLTKTSKVFELVHSDL
ncbi:hypothetical protein OSB04_031470 [Centaurea solstitialis]|uniref:Uncharacterized protein n=1 Tax=Centaurea solstitialis TaxID=347529 RepID=A0AA38ST34_9ASTR|nr:hypothetical protein OSB04_031470 [Centaurea solstitialis]